MPDAAGLRVCADCWRLTDQVRCQEHRRTHEAARRQTLDPRYGSQRWREYSAKRLARHPFCAACGRLAKVTDHIKPVRDFPELFFDRSNHRSLCQRCNRAAADAPVETTRPEVDVDDGPAIA